MKNLFYRKICSFMIFLSFFSIQILAQNGWTSITTVPTPRGAASASVIDNKIYVIGGNTGAPNWIEKAENEVYDPLTDNWDTTKSDMPTPRGWLTTAVVNDNIYAIGGRYPNHTNKNEAYDPVTDTWTTKAPMPTVRRAMQSGVVDGIIYVIGGNESSRDCLAYDPVANSWTIKAPVPVGGGGDLAVAVYNGLIYAFGGGYYTVEVGPYNKVYAYDPQTNTWDTTLTPMPTPRFAMQAYVMGDSIYVIGGSQSYGTSLSIVEVYDPVSDTWETSPDSMPVPLCYFAGAVVNNKIFVISGTSDWATGDDSVRVYDPLFVSVEQELTSPTEFILYQNFPNPFNPSTKISWQSPVGSWQTLKVFDVLGNEIATLVDEYKPAGSYEIEWNASNYPSGIYFYQLKAGNYIETKKMLLLK